MIVIVIVTVIVIQCLPIQTTSRLTSELAIPMLFPVDFTDFAPDFGLQFSETYNRFE